MNTALYRRRWLMIRPWIKDSTICMGFIVACVLTMWMVEHLPQACTSMGICAP